MQKETKKHVKRLRGFTLVELILVVGTIALVAGALIGLAGNSYKDFRLGSDRSTLLQDGQAAMVQMVQLLRQTKGFVSVSTPDDQAGQVTFATGDISGGFKQFRLNTQTNELEYGQPSTLSALVGQVTRLVFTCYDINGDTVTDPIQLDRIRSVHIEMTFVDAEDSSVTFTLSDIVVCQKESQYVVINEIMYYPTGHPEAQCEWVELHNFGKRSVDLTGWEIWTDDPINTDVLEAHSKGNGSMIIPANGYAIITAKNTKVTGVDMNAVWLSTGKTKIGNLLGNIGTCIVTVTDGTNRIDSVTYSNTWGGDGDGKTLARVDPYYGDSDSPDNWQPGPTNGTPGSEN